MQRWGCSLGHTGSTDGSVTQVQPGFLSSRFGNKDKACHACDWKCVFFRGGICKSYCDVFVALLTRFPSFPSPILPLFFGDYFPMLSFLPALFLFFLVCTRVFPMPFLSCLSTGKVTELISKLCHCKSNIQKPNNHKSNKNHLPSSLQFFSFRQKGPGGGECIGTRSVYVHLTLSLLEPNILQEKYSICAADSLLLLWSLPATGNGTE